MKKYFFLLLILLVGLVSPLLPVQAQTVSVGLSGNGSCYAAGSTVTVTTALSSVDHSALAYRADGTQPSAVWQIDPSVYFAHNFDTSTTYTLPNAAVTGAKIWADGHDASHNHVVWGATNAFSIDNSPPSAPANLTATKTGSTVTLFWEASSDSGCAGLTGYKIFRGGTQVGTSSSTTFTDTGLTGSTAYSYTVQAYDSVDSTTSSALAVTTDIATATSPSASPSPRSSSSTSPSPSPSASKKETTPPQLSNSKARDITQTQATINTETDEPATITINYGLTKEYGKSESSSDKKKSTTIILKDLEPNKTYHYQVKAKDEQGNEATGIDRTFQTLSADQTPEPKTILAEAALTTIEISNQTIAPTLDSSLQIIPEKQPEIKLNGVATPKSTVSINVYSTVRTYTAAADNKGVWSATVKIAGLEEGHHRVTTFAKDPSGNLTEEKEVLKFVALADVAGAQPTIAVSQTGAHKGAPTVVLWLLILGGMSGIGYVGFTRYSRQKHAL